MNNILNPIKFLFQHCARHWASNLVWWIRIARVDTEKNVRFGLPLRISGKGKLKFESGCRLGANASFNCCSDSMVLFSMNCIIGANLNFTILPGCSAVFGERSRIFQDCHLSVAEQWEIGADSCIESNCSISSRELGLGGRFLVGNKSYIGENTIIDTSGGVFVGNHVAIGPNCIIYTHDHEPDTKLDGVWMGRIKTIAVNIGDGAWIGAGVTILPGVKIGKHAVIGAGSLVTHDIPDNWIAYGVPAKAKRQLNN